MKTDKILFLDIDGVLNRRPTKVKSSVNVIRELTHDEFMGWVEGLSPLCTSSV